MKEAARKYGALLLVLVTVSAVCLLAAHRKAGMFIDEIYTYGLSNSYYAPYLQDAADGSLEDVRISREDLQDYLTVGPGEGFAFGSVYYNQVHDVHPPLYYWLFHIVSSLTPGVFSKWTGLLLDYGLYMLTLVLLYALAMVLWDSRFCAAATAAAYGLSIMGVSTMLMIRMYVLMTLLTVQLALLVALLMKEKKPAYYPLIGLTVFLGLMTQYYFVFYAFFLCAGYVIFALCRKDFKSLGLFALCAFAGVGLLLLCFPASLDHLFAEKLVSGGSALENLRDRSLHGVRLRIFTEGMRLRKLKAARYTVYLLAALLLLRVRRLPAALGELHCALAPGLVLILPALITFPLVAVISPVVSDRYLYNIIPILCLLPGFLLRLWQQCCGEVPLPKMAAVLAAVLLLGLWQNRENPPDYICPEQYDFNVMIDAHADAACVYFTDNYSSPLTQDLLQLIRLEDVFVTADPASQALADYLAGRDTRECLVYIDTNSYWTDGYVPKKLLPEILENTDYTAWEHLYDYGLSSAYLFVR